MNENYELIKKGTGYETPDTVVKCKKCGNTFTCGFHNFTRKNYQLCPFCEVVSKHPTKEQAEFKLKMAGEDYEILEFRKMTSSTLKHKCGFINENANISRILSRNTKHCFNCSRMSVAYKPEFIKEEIDKLTNGEYTVLSDYQKENIPVLMRHNKCGYEWKVIRRNFVYRNTRCPKCSILTTRSRGCDFLTDYFKKNNIKFEIEKTFDECKSKRVLPFDFYLDSRNLLIEYDGEMHFHKRRDDDKEYTLQKLRDTHKHDLIKNEFCKNNNINLLRLPYDISNGDIERILDEYFEFENIGSTTIENLNIYFNDENNNYYDNRYSEE